MNRKIIFPFSILVLFISFSGMAWLQKCKDNDMRIWEITLPRGEYYTNIANRVQFMYVIQEEIVRISHSNKYDEQYLQCKYGQIEDAFTNLTRAVAIMESLLRETHNGMINCDSKRLSCK